MSFITTILLIIGLINWVLILGLILAINNLNKIPKEEEEINAPMKIVIKPQILGDFTLPFFYVINDANQHRWDKKTNTFRSLSDYGTAFDSLEAARESFATVNQHYIKDYSDNGLLTARAIDVDVTHGSLLAKIVEINAANNWVADWDDPDQIKFWLTWDHLDSEKGCESSCRFNNGNPVMCLQARDYMLSDQVSDADFKAYLKIYD